LAHLENQNNKKLCFLNPKLLYTTNPKKMPMHETIIAKKIIDEAKKHGSVKSIMVEVGDLAHVPADELKQALINMTQWKIQVSKRTAKVHCRCGFEGPPKILEKSHDNTIFECPKCKEVPEIIHGDSIILREIKVK